MKTISARHYGVIGFMAAGLAIAGGCAGGGDKGGVAGERLGKSQMLLKPTGSFLVLASAFNQVNFEPQLVGTTSGARTAQLRNDGTSSLTIGTLSLSGTHASDFALGLGTTCSGATLAPAATCTVELSFTAGGAGRRFATLNVANDAAGNTHEIPITGVGVPTTGFSPTAGPVDPRYGFPAWYQDANGVKLEPCVESSTLCPAPLPDLLDPPSVTHATINYPDESFYWMAEAEIRPTGSIRARLVLALEATFGGTGSVTVGEQIVFGRIRLRLEEVAPFTSYTFTHPFGTRTIDSDDDGKIDLTEDIGCGASPCDFRQALNSEIVQSFLKWDPAFAPAAPAGYLGNPSVTHRITGSPTGNNLFRVDGPGVGGGTVATIQTNLFELAGKLLP
jgi:hypothetical protein